MGCGSRLNLLGNRRLTTVTALTLALLCLAQWSATSWAGKTPPDTTISGGPSGVVVPNLSFSFTANPSTGASFECSLDGASYTSCASPKSYQGLSEGLHAFRVRAANSAGTDQTPAERGFRVVSTAKAVTKIPSLDKFERQEVPLAAGKWSKTSWSGQIGGSWCCGSYRGFGSSGSSLAGAYWNPTSFSDGGAETVLVSGKVGSGATTANEYLALWLDMPSPSSAGRSGYEARFTGVNGSASNYKVELSKWASGTRAILASTTGFSLSVGTTIALTQTAGGSLGLWTGQSSLTSVLTANDATYGTGYAGLEVNGGGGTIYDFRAGRIDIQAPDTTIQSGPSGLVMPQDVSFSFASTESGSSFECSLDGGSFGACSSPAAYPSIADGAHTFAVRAVDAVSNQDPSPAERTFTVAKPPTATTGAATSVQSTGAILNASVNPNGLASTYRFEYGTSSAYGSTVPATAKAIGSGTTSLAVSEPLAALSPGTTYHYRITATSSAGTAKGADQTLTTLSAPNATTLAATNVEGTEATLNARVTPMGASTTYQFEYGETSAYGNKVPASPKAIGSGMTPVAVSERLSGLTAGVLYHYRVVTGNEFGTTTGGDRTFELGATAPGTRLVGGEYGVTALTVTGFDLVSEPEATFECRLDAGAWKECSAHAGYVNLAPGAHRFEARAVGVTGAADPTPAYRDWTINPLGPMDRPAINGTPRIGHTLSVTNGTWGGSSPSGYSYQWFRCPSDDPSDFGSCAPVPGATQPQYQLTQADEEERLVAKVTAIRNDGGGSPQELTTISRYPLAAIIDALVPPLGDRILYANCTATNCGLSVSRANGSEAIYAVDGQGNYTEMALSPNGTLIVYYSTYENCIKVAAAQSNATSKNVLCGDPEGNYFFEDPTFTPDGRIVFVSRLEHSLKRINVDGTGLTTLFSWPGYPTFQEPSISADGTKIAFWSNQDPTGAYKPGIWVSTMGGGNAQYIPETNRGFDLSPDGTKIAYTLAMPFFPPPGPRKNQVYVADIATGNVNSVADGNYVYGRPSWSADGEQLIVTRGEMDEEGFYFHEGSLLIDVDDGSEGPVLPGRYTPSFRQPSRPNQSTPPPPPPSDLLERYKPVVFYYPGEEYSADAVTGAIDWHENYLYYSNTEVSDAKLVLADNDPVDTTFPDLTGTLLGTESGSQYEGISMNGNNQEAGDWGHNLPGMGNHVYGVVKQSSTPGVVWLQYWFFYYINPAIDAGGTDIGEHEGDWEFVQYAYDTNTDQLLRASYNQHGGAEVCLPGSLDYVVTSSGRVAPAVYVAWRSHASYFAPGNYNLHIGGPLDLGNDLASAEAGATELTLSKLLDEPWSSWEGHWGDTEGSSVPGEASSPHGPGHAPDNDDEETDPDRVAEEADGCSVS